MEFLKAKEVLKEDLKAAMKDKSEASKAKNEAVKAVISTVSAKLNAVYKDAELKGVPCTEEDVNGVFAFELKQIKETLEGAEKSGRESDIAKAKAQKEYVEKFLPKQLNDEEIVSELKTIFAELGLDAPTKKDFGAIMKVASVRFKGRADGKLVSKLAQGLL